MNTTRGYGEPSTALLEQTKRVKVSLNQARARSEECTVKVGYQQTIPKIRSHILPHRVPLEHVQQLRKFTGQLTRKVHGLARHGMG